MTNTTLTPPASRDPNRAWKEASLSAAKTDARDFFHGALLHAHNGNLYIAELRFNSCLYYLSQVHQFAQELTQWRSS